MTSLTLATDSWSAARTASRRVARRTYFENIGPRFGFAYDPTGTGKSAIRGAFGIYYEPGNGNDANDIGLEGNAPATLAPTGYYINGYDFSSGSIAGYSPASIQAIPYHQKNPAVAQYNLNVQHEFKGNNFLTVGYVGNQGRHLDTNQNLNQIPIPVVPTMSVAGLVGLTIRAAPPSATAPLAMSRTS